MKKVIFIFLAILVICGVAIKADADEASIEYQIDAIIETCDKNAELFEILDSLVGINVLFFKTRIIILPTKDFYKLIKEVVADQKQKHNYVELFDELNKENKNMIQLLKQITFKAEKIK